MASFRDRVAQLSEMWPVLLDVAQVNVDEHGWVFEHDYRDMGKQGYEDTGPFPVAIGVRLMSIDDFIDKTDTYEMRMPAYRWGHLKLRGWPVIHSGKDVPWPLREELEKAARQFLEAMEQLDHQIADARLTPKIMQERDRILAEADMTIRRGLVDLAKRHPQLTAVPRLWNHIEQPSPPGSISIRLSYTDGRSKSATVDHVPEGQGFGITVFLRRPRAELEQMATMKLYPNLDLDGHIGSGADDPQLQEALRKLANDALAPLAALNDQAQQVGHDLEQAIVADSGESAKAAATGKTQTADKVDVEPTKPSGTSKSVALRREDQHIDDQPVDDAQVDLQSLIDSAEDGSTVVVPNGVYTKPIRITKSLTLKGESAVDCVFEVTANEPAILVDTKGKGTVTLLNITVKWQLANSDPCESPMAVAVKDTKACVVGCIFSPLGNFKRCPVALGAVGFTDLAIDDCRFEGYEYTVCFREGTTGSIRNSLVMGSGHQGVSLYAGATVTATGNLITGSKFHGLRNTGGTLNMTDNLVIDNANRGVYLGNKSAAGIIANNVIMGNATGISGFARSKVTIENNIIANSGYAGVSFRESCSLVLRDNIFLANQRGLIMFDQEPPGTNIIHRNTFWKNETDAENIDLPADSILADPQFADVEHGDFTLKPGPVSEHKQGLTDPQVIRKIWQRRHDHHGDDAESAKPGARTDEKGRQTVVVQTVASREAENEQLQSQLSDASARQIQQIMGAAWTYAMKHNNRFPSRPSQLREVMGEDGWRWFIAPYMDWERSNEVLAMDDRWRAIDKLGSYTLHGGVRGSRPATQVVLSEKAGSFRGQRWFYFADAHGSRDDPAAVIRPEPDNTEGAY